MNTSFKEEVAGRCKTDARDSCEAAVNLGRGVRAAVDENGAPQKTASQPCLVIVALPVCWTGFLNHLDS